MDVSILVVAKPEGDMVEHELEVKKKKFAEGADEGEAEATFAGTNFVLFDG